MELTAILLIPSLFFIAYFEYFLLLFYMQLFGSVFHYTGDGG